MIKKFDYKESFKHSYLECSGSSNNFVWNLIVMQLNVGYIFRCIQTIGVIDHKKQLHNMLQKSWKRNS